MNAQQKQIVQRAVLTKLATVRLAVNHVLRARALQKQAADWTIRGRATSTNQPTQAEWNATAARRMNPQGQIPSFMQPGFAQINPATSPFTGTRDANLAQQQAQNIVSTGMAANPAPAPRTDDLTWGWEDEPALATGREKSYPGMGNPNPTRRPTANTIPRPNSMASYRP